MLRKSITPFGLKMTTVKSNHPAIKEGRTVFTNSIINRPSPLHPANNNYKLSKGGKIIKKGKWKGQPMYSLTMEERKTCPTDCKMWAKCYGNNMYLAKRYKHGEELNGNILNQLIELGEKYPKGFVVRLHILGDFYSIAYVAFWARMMIRFPQMTVFGYSARNSGAIHKALKNLRYKYLDRWYIRFSSNKEGRGKLIYASDEEGKKGFQCPETNGKVRDCISCMLCLSATKTVWFPTH
jgi:hypothetical protein